MAKAVEIPAISVDRFFSVIFEDDHGTQLTLEERPQLSRPQGGLTIKLSEDMTFNAPKDLAELAYALTIYAESGKLPRDRPGF